MRKTPSSCSHTHPPHPPCSRESDTGLGKFACANERYHLVIADAGTHPQPLIIRPRQVLKLMLRAFGIKAVEVTNVECERIADNRECENG